MRVVKIFVNRTKLANMQNNNSLMSLRWSTVFGISIFLFSAAAQVKVGRVRNSGRQQFNVSFELWAAYCLYESIFHGCDVFFNCFIKADGIFVVLASPTPTILFAHMTVSFGLRVILPSHNYTDVLV